ncbi:39S ribosomal protein L46, mitochondrial-like isoform X2 [Phoenix dactylifera]|uniref:Large ribosomal subunit protein mL46 n=1 Tax=Phoenix dactylifera TaxID=42345 RepID=A0A8B9ANR9_PHODC|nr:39S ribosomal protein L46, mitochondrial-like isoform X2 [Phoenix dactylifera]
MQRAAASLLLRTLRSRGFSSSSSDKIIATVLFERLPVVIPKIDPVVYAFQEFSFRWRQQYRRRYPDEVLGRGDARSLQRALDRRLYLLLNGSTYGAPDKKPVWHFPEKVYENEETLRLCAESALRSVLGGLHHTYFVGNAPMAHMAVEPKEDSSDTPSFKRFFFKSQVIGTSKLHIGKCQDYVWVTKDELMDYFPEQADFFNKMIIS